MARQFRIPKGFYSAEPAERVAALRKVTCEARDSILGSIEWPVASPGTINSWLVFIGPSPGASPANQNWNYDPRPAFGGPHPGVAEYAEKKGFWAGIRNYTRAVFPELSTLDGYGQTMLRNLDTASSATAPKGAHMSYAAQAVFDVLEAVIRPRLIVSIGGARTYTDPSFQNSLKTKRHNSGVLLTALKGKECKWFSLSGRWATGEPFLYVSPSGIHPSIRHVSESDCMEFLCQQSLQAREL